MKILAVIQARGGSKTIPKKNIYPINGHPLISYTINAALKSKYIDRLVVSTDSKEIKEIAVNYGAEVPFLRPPKLSKDNTYSVDSLRHAVIMSEKIYKEQYDFIIELPCVCPLRTNVHIDEAISILKKNSKLDSVTSYVNTGEKHPIRLKRIKSNTNITSFCRDYIEPPRGSRKQNFENCYIRNGAIYAMTRNCILKMKSRHGKKQYAYIMDERVSLNIDYDYDLLLAKLLIENGYCENNPIKKPKYYFNRDRNKKSILITAPFDFLNKEKKELNQLYNCDFLYGASKKEILLLSDKYEGWICAPSPKYKIDEDILKKFKLLKIIVTPSTGTNHIDIIACKKYKKKVLGLKNSKFVRTIKASSEFTFALALSLVRKIPLAAKYPLQGKWREEENNLRSFEIYKKKIGIIGYGRIGQNVSKYFKSLKCEVYYFDPYVKIKSSNAKKVSLTKILKECNIILLSANLTKETKNLCNLKFFKSIKNKAYFVNTSRGELVDEKALLYALKNKILKGAALDVICNEQTGSIKSNILYNYMRDNNNLIITPHIAGLSIDSEQKAAQTAIKLLRKNLI